MASSSLTTDANVQPPIISDYSGGGFTIGGMFYAGSVMITGEDGTGYVIEPWSVDDAETISVDNLGRIYQSANRPNLIVLGIGDQMNHPFAQLRAALSKQGIAVEILTTPAACRTWNLLLSEGRKVAFAAIASKIS